MIKAQSVSSGCSLRSARCQKHLPREAPSGITGRGFSSPGSWRMTLTLRKTVIKGETAHGDYLVLEDGKAIGRIRLGHGLNGAMRWYWNVTVHVLPEQRPVGERRWKKPRPAFKKAWERDCSICAIFIR